MKKSLVVASLIVLMSIATASATLKTTTSGGSSGGGSSKSVGTTLRQDVHIGKNLTMSGHVNNNPWGNASFTGKLRLADGKFGPTDKDFKSFLFADMINTFYGDPYNARTIYAEMNISFYSHKGMFSDPTNNMAKPNTNFAIQTDVFSPGINISISSQINSNMTGHPSFPNLYFQS